MAPLSPKDDNKPTLSDNEKLHNSKRVVIKCGSALLVDSKTGKVRANWLASLAADINTLRGRGVEVLVVSSGAVAIGRKILGLKLRKTKLEEKQAAAATGQVELMKAWQEALGQFGLHCAQSLLTAYDTERRRNWLNARSTFDTLLGLGIVPVINENDTIATEEIRYGDNDRLAARVAQMVGADLLLLLSDIDGLYTADPHSEPNARHIPRVEEISLEIENMAGGSNAIAGVGSGGMKTKIDAAKIAISQGCNVMILDGRENHPVKRALNGAKSTLFAAELDPQTARMAWLKHNLKPQGAYLVDAGAAGALLKGASLLPVGVKDVEGNFERADAVAIKTLEGQIIARGLSAYSTHDAMKIIGKKSSEVEEILGYSGRPALVHRDDMVVEH